MLARNNIGTVIPLEQELEVCNWVSDGISSLIGFTGTGTCSAEFRLYVGTDNNPWYVAQISPQARTAYIADRGTILEEGIKVSLRVYHESPGEQRFKGTILGG